MPKATCCDVRIWVTAPISCAPRGTTAPISPNPAGPGRSAAAGPGRAEPSGAERAPFPGRAVPPSGPGPRRASAEGAEPQGRHLPPGSGLRRLGASADPGAFPPGLLGAVPSRKGRCLPGLLPHTPAPSPPFSVGPRVTSGVAPCPHQAITSSEYMAVWVHPWVGVSTCQQEGPEELGSLPYMTHPQQDRAVLRPHVSTCIPLHLGLGH